MSTHNSNQLKLTLSVAGTATEAVLTQQQWSNADTPPAIAQELLSAVSAGGRCSAKGAPTGLTLPGTERTAVARLQERLVDVSAITMRQARALGVDTDAEDTVVVNDAVLAGLLRISGFQRVVSRRVQVRGIAESVYFRPEAVTEAEAIAALRCGDAAAKNLQATQP